MLWPEKDVQYQLRLPYPRPRGTILSPTVQGYHGSTQVCQFKINSGLRIILTNSQVYWRNWSKTSRLGSFCPSSSVSATSAGFAHLFVRMRTTMLLRRQFLFEVQAPLVPSSPWLITLHHSTGNHGGMTRLATISLIGKPSHTKHFLGILLCSG